MEIVDLTRKNYKETLALTNSVFPLDAAKKWPEIAYKSSLGYKTAIRRNMDTEWLRYWVTYRDEKIVGTIGLYRMKKEKRCWVGWFCVNPAYRGLGIGRRLLEFAIDQAEDLGHDALWLYTVLDPESGPAQILYEKMGFAIQERFEEEPYPMLYRKISLKGG